MHPLIRLARPNDLDSLIALERNCFDPKKYDMISCRQFHYFLTQSTAKLYVAVWKKSLIGTAILCFRKNSKKARLYSLGVLPEFQGQSIGKLLYEYLEKTLKKNGYQCITAEYRAKNRGLEKFYDKLGFVFMNEILNYYPDGQSASKIMKAI